MPKTGVPYFPLPLRVQLQKEANEMALFFETLLLLLVTFAFGLGLGWLIWKDSRNHA
jgi:hypothetical protein